MTEMCSSLRRLTRLSAIVALAAIALSASAASAQSPLGSAQNFAVLGATTVTNTGLTIVTGNLGVSPGTAITGFPPGVVVGGTIHAGDPVAARAQADAGMANAGLKALACPAINNLSGQVLGTRVLSLPPGVYCFNTSAQLTGTLFLTGAGPWVFQVGTTLTTASNSHVVVVDPTNCGSNVFWQIGSSATLGTATQFVGNILAAASITLTAATSVSGSVVALTAAVTMDTNHVSVCIAGPGTPEPGDGDGDGDHDGDCDCHDHDGDHDGHHGDKDHHDGDCDGHHHDDDHDGHHGDKDHKEKDHDGDCDCHHHDGDHDGHHGDKHKDKDHDKDHKDKDHDQDHKDQSGKGKK